MVTKIVLSKKKKIEQKVVSGLVKYTSVDPRRGIQRYLLKDQVIRQNSFLG